MLQTQCSSPCPDLKELKTMWLIMWIVTLVPDCFIITLMACGAIMPESWYDFECGLKGSQILIVQFYSDMKSYCCHVNAVSKAGRQSQQPQKPLLHSCCPPLQVRFHIGWLQLPVPSSGVLPENNCRRNEKTVISLYNLLLAWWNLPMGNG